ncbi:hypothetical protein SHIRM173S_10841 [Streptomyces hirsutus]
MVRSARRRVMSVDEPVQRHRLKRAQLVSGEEFMQNEQHALREDFPVKSSALAYRARVFLVLVGPGHVPRTDLVSGTML